MTTPSDTRTAGTDGGFGLYPSRVVGHRGACALAPENTLASIRRAAADGAAMVELDVMLTADDRPVIIHDDLVDRTTDGSGAVDAMPLAALGALDAGAWFGAGFAGETVPTLEEALETILDLGIGLNLEIKPSAGRDAETARVALSVARDLWPSGRPAPVISSFSREAMAVARDLAADWSRALLSDDVPGDWAEAALILDVKALHLGDAGASEAAVRGVIDGGHPVAVWTVNDAARARVLWGWGVAAVITDDPGALLRADGAGSGG